MKRIIKFYPKKKGSPLKKNTNQTAKNKRYYVRFFKRPLDIFLASIGLLLLTPVFFVMIILLKWIYRTHVIRVEKRTGLHEKIIDVYTFNCYKSKKFHPTEYDANQMDKINLAYFLKNSGILYLPMLYNVLKGDLSMVGPKPLYVENLSYYTKTERKRHASKPGFVSPANVTWRKTISLAQKLDRDIEYVQNISFLKDCILLLKGFISLFRIQIEKEESSILQDENLAKQRHKKINELLKN